MEEALLSTPINPNNFPAKLWRLVNSPRYRSIRWDGRGEGLLIDQPLFEPELFKTTNFTSFIRQLNLYGFRKVVLGGPGAAGPGPGPGGGGPAGDGPLHHFHSPHFRRDQPQLLVHLKRLTNHPGQHGETLSLLKYKNLLGVVAGACSPSYSGG
uniref:Heat shock factor protein 5 n=1 Tax=Theropithecus gelada TaxID=9565 RepID=A0A8D2FSK3_THEGE